jgi:hypothetical protein
MFYLFHQYALTAVNTQSLGASSSNGFIPSIDTRNFVGKHKLQHIKTLIQRTTPLDEIKLPHQHQLLYPFDEYSQLRQVLVLPIHI